MEDGIEQKDSMDGRVYSQWSRSGNNGERFFHSVKVEREGVSQVTHVNLNIHPEPVNDDPCSGCFKGIAKVFR